MAMDRFLIAPYNENSGLQTDVKPWLIPDEAFAALTNAYVFRGRVRKRFGSRWMGDNQLLSRFRVNLGNTNGAGNFAGFTPQSAGSPIVTPAIGQMFSVGTQIFTVNALGNPANLLISGAAAAATFDTTTGAVTITGAALATAVYYYPALPVMGLISFESGDVNDEPVFGFDTRFAYQYVGGWERLDGEITAGASHWTGNNSQFFWGSTWTGANASDKVLFVTNFNENEPNFMRRFFTNQWENFRPLLTSVTVGPTTTTTNLDSARVIVPFKNRLVAFNTWESTTVTTPPNPPVPGAQVNYPNRCRYSQIGSPLAVDAWRQDTPGKGSAIDAPTTEAIVTVEFIKDRLVVFFERSTWELVYTGNQAYPFAWQQINTELGAESTFSIVPFDKVALGVGNVGIHACNGANVERIDTKIPDAVFDIHNVDQGIFRVYGIRDYFVEMVYWTFPDATRSNDFPYPNRVLIFNYKTGTWALNEDSITAFGYFQAPTGINWNSTTVTWDDPVSWDSGALAAQFRNVLGGNQEGYTFIVDPNTTTNASVIQITDITVAANILTITAIDHNFQEGDFVFIEEVVGTGNLNLLNDTIFKVLPGATPNTFQIMYDPSVVIAGVYAGAGVLSRVSNIVLKTKQYNFYAQQGRNAYVQKVDFMVDTTDAGQLQVDFFVSTSLDPIVQNSGPLGTGALIGTSVLDTFPYPTIPFEANSERVWHPVYLQADGECVQLQLSMNDEQMMDTDIRGEDFQLHAMCIYANPTSYRFQ